MPTSASKPILLIDDDALQLRVRQAVLQQAGFQVETVTSGDEALRLLQPGQGREFAAVITDHLLAESSGAELVPQIRVIQPHIPIAVITGLPGAEDEYRSEEHTSELQSHSFI